MITGEIFKMLALRKKMKISLNPVTEIIICLWFSLHTCISFNLQSQVGTKCNLLFPSWISVRSPSLTPLHPQPPAIPLE